ncbi:MAG: M23 family metallopeptidase [bacterium]|nr:M23 family metallopeptidase [bacterium]
MVKNSRMYRSLALLAVLAGATLSASATAAAQAIDFPPPFEVLVPMPPTPVLADDDLHLFYEVHLTNFARSARTLLRASVADGAGTTLIELAGDDLIAAIRVIGDPTSESTVIGAGQRMVLYFHVRREADAGVPGSLVHRFEVENPRQGTATEAEPLALDGIAVEPRSGPAVNLGPPLKGGLWLAGGGPSNTSGHRRTMIPLDGAVPIAQRFAIDFVQVDDTGATFSGDAEDNTTYYCHGADAIAVADAVVVDTLDGVPENVPGLTSRAVELTLRTVAGNYVILDLGDGLYAFYAHLIPGSLRVKEGERVTRGQVLALVGNSGNSTESHLHFHVGNRASPLGAEGLPYTFDSFVKLGNSSDLEAAITGKGETRRGEIPLEDDLVRFPD